MKLRVWMVQGRALLLTAVLAVWLSGCGGDGSGTNPGSETGTEFRYGTLTDGRDGKRYKTCVIDGKTWMAENLNYQTDGSLCYDNDNSNCNKYGRLYNWTEALTVCPPGWRLPSHEDWVGLATTVGGFDVAGKKLKAKNGWDEYGNGTDDYGFSALPGGKGSSRGVDGEYRFSEGGTYAAWWIPGGTVTHIHDDGEVHTFEFSGGIFELDRNDGADIDDRGGNYYFSVRCASGE
jgi:uncharacterized protein (TIGR02145 family)